MTRYDGLIAKLREAAQPDRPAPADFASYLDKVSATPTRSPTPTSRH